MLRKPPYIKLYIKEFAIDTQDLSNEELGKYMRALIKSYKTGKVIEKYKNENIFIELIASFDKYLAVCTKNKNNRNKSITCDDQWSTSGQPVVNQSSTSGQPVVKKEQKLTREKTYIDLIPSYVDRSLWIDFMKQRGKMKCINSERAIKMIIGKLDEFIEKGHNPNEIIKKSIENSWKSVYEPTGGGNERYRYGKEGNNEKDKQADEALERSLRKFGFTSES